MTAGHRLAETTTDAEWRTWLARRLIACDPYDEKAHRQLVMTLFESGETREAERAHTSWAAALSELGVEVEPLEGFRPV